MNRIGRRSPIEGAREEITRTIAELRAKGVTVPIGLLKAYHASSYAWPSAAFRDDAP